MYIYVIFTIPNIGPEYSLGIAHVFTIISMLQPQESPSPLLIPLNKIASFSFKNKIKYYSSKKEMIKK